MTSQFLAIFFLNDLDHFIKEKLKCKYYIRYMDDFLIFDTDKNKLKFIWNKIQEELNKLELTMNPKSGIHKLTTVITFLGYSYKVINNKFKISYRKKTYKKIYKKLKKLKKKNLVQYYKSYASYYGYLNKIVKQERRFKMKAVEKHAFYKEKYPNHIIFIKVGSFYKTFFNYAVIMWHFFDYKWNEGAIAFGASPYSKVLDKLNQLEISYVVVLNNDEIQVIDNDTENYELYLKIAKKRYKKFTEKSELYNLFNEVIDNNPHRYEELKQLLNNF